MTSLRYPEGDGVRVEGETRNGLREGCWTWWHPEGPKRLERHYVAGIPQGEETAWFTSGQVLHQGELKDGRREGTWTFWYEAGTRHEEGRYDEGRREGEWRQWWPKEVLHSVFSYEAGVLQGADRVVHAGGEPRLDGAWSNDRPVGEWIERDAEGGIAWRHDFPARD